MFCKATVQIRGINSFLILSQWLDMHDLRWEKCTSVCFLQPIFSKSNQSLIAYHPFLQYLGEDGDTIRAIHTTPIMSYEDKMNFTFTDASGGTCQVKVRFYFAKYKGIVTVDNYVKKYVDEFHCLTAVAEEVWMVKMREYEEGREGHIWKPI